MPATFTITPDFPPLTAAQIAAVLGKSSTAVRKQLVNIAATGCRRVSGNDAAQWHAAALPADLRAELQTIARANGFNSVGEMFRAGQKAWQPAITPADDDPVWSAARKLRDALRPSLQRNPMFALSQADFERDGVRDYEKVFGTKISTRHFRSLIIRTRNRDGGRANWEALAIYLPDKLKRKSDAPRPPLDFPLIEQAINDPEQMQAVRNNHVVEVSRRESIWKAAFETYDRLLLRHPPKRAARMLRDYLAERALLLLAPNRDALLKTFQRRLLHWLLGNTADDRQSNGAADGELTRQINDLPWFIPAVKYFFLRTNRTENSGSLPEALRHVISLPCLPVAWQEGLRQNFLKAIKQPAMPECPVELREMILARERAGKKMVPDKIAAKMRVNKSVVKFSRSPHEWSLANQTAPGSQRRFFDVTKGERVIMQPGDWFGGDDATPGIAVTVPCNEVITPVSQKYGVLLGRFQWLAYNDCRTDKILGWDYVVRPRGSYRAEDILNGMGAVVRTHGIPRQGFQFEGGTFGAKLVKQAIKLLGCQHWRTYSPHQKPVESVFNRVWTQLAVQFPHADMGRYRNENEANCKLYEACKAGHKDPRRFFPTIDLVLKSFEEVVKNHNGKMIRSKQYGQWVPDEFFAAAQQASPLREHSPEMDWMFSPFSAERTVKGMIVSCRVPMFENFSVPFDFGADWMPQYHGKKVRLHFNPHHPKCVAKVVLSATNKVLGDAHLIGETAEHIRYILNWGDDDQRAGYLQRQRVGNFVRRETRGIGTGGRVEYSKSEQRDGLNKIAIVQRGAPQNVVEKTESNSERRLLENLAAVQPSASPVSAADSGDNGRASRRAELAELEKETAHLFT
jgi:hypothetical protein